VAAPATRPDDTRPRPDIAAALDGRTNPVEPARRVAVSVGT